MFSQSDSDTTRVKWHRWTSPLSVIIVPSCLMECEASSTHASWNRRTSRVGAALPPDVSPWTQLIPILPDGAGVCVTVGRFPWMTVSGGDSRCVLISFTERSRLTGKTHVTEGTYCRGSGCLPPQARGFTAANHPTEISVLTHIKDNMLKNSVRNFLTEWDTKRFCHYSQFKYIEGAKRQNIHKYMCIHSGI